MVKNRSVPTNVLLPHIAYDNVADAVVWLTRVFGFAEHYHYGEPGGAMDGAQMHRGDAWIMLTRARAGRASPAQAGHWTQMLTIFIDNLEQHYMRVKASGANIVEELNETMYGELQYAAEDLEGHRWLFSQHIRDVGPDEWGAVITNS